MDDQDIINDSALKQRQHYQKNAAHYVSSRQESAVYTQFLESWIDRLFAPWLQSTTEAERGLQTVLDPMCGHGNLAPYLIGQCQRLYLNDVSPEMLEYIPPDIRDQCEILSPSDICHLELPSNCADVVIVSGGLHHVYRNLAEALSEIFRVLKPGGTFLFGEPSNEFIVTRMSRNLIYRFSSSFDHENEVAFRWKELREFMSEAGFMETEINPFGSIAYLLMSQVGIVPWLKNSRSPRLFRLLRQLDENIENSPFLNRSCFALTGSTRKPA